MKQEEDVIRIAACAEVWMRGDLGDVIQRTGVETGGIGKEETVAMRALMQGCASAGLFAGLCAVLGLAACQERALVLRDGDRVASAVDAAATMLVPRADEARPVDLPGVHNVVTYHEGFVVGGVPEGNVGFAALEAMGVKTVISVDGGVPEVEVARARGMRYIHLPIGYSGFDDERKGELVRAVRDAMADGPVYLHCHHGKHRAAGAAAAVAASLGWMTPEEGVARMKVSGTAPGYTGLYACAANAMVMSAAAIDAVPAEFPEVQRPKGLVATMVEIDEITDHLKVIAKAGWAAPADHPDLVPVAEAGRLADLLRVLHEREDVKSRPAGYTAMMVSSAGKAQMVEDSLASGANRATLDAQWAEVVASCVACHKAHRD